MMSLRHTNGHLKTADTRGCAAVRPPMNEFVCQSLFFAALLGGHTHKQQSLQPSGALSCQVGSSLKSSAKASDAKSDRCEVFVPTSGA